MRFPWLRPSYSRLVAALIVLSLGACGGSSSESTESASYTTRGIVRQLGDGPSQELFIHHEAIPSFVNIDGEVQGMDSMAMPFPVDEAALPGDLQVGDKVSFEFEVNWTGSPPMRLLSLEKLPPETLLAFEMPQSSDSPSDSSEGHGHHGNHDHLGDQEHGGLGHGGGDTGADHGDHSDHTTTDEDPSSVTEGSNDG